MGVHNTWEELIEAQKVNQLERLKLTKTGQALLRNLGYTVGKESHLPQSIPHEIKDKIHVCTIPRNMHPEHDKGRRQARAQLLQQRLSSHNNNESVRYTDAAKYRGVYKYVASVVDETGRELAAASTHANDVTTAEELGIALAITTSSSSVTIVTDSQEACRRFLKGTIGRSALQVLLKCNFEDASILWTPGHESLAGNRAAHAAAREHTHRATPQRYSDSGNTEERIPRKYSEILAHYRKQRRHYPPAHKRLTREQAVTWRRLQAGTYPHGTLLHAMYPGNFSRNCRYCPESANTLYHMVWGCRNNPSVPPLDEQSVQENPEDQWEALLTSQNPEDQLRLVDRALASAASHGYLE